MNRQVETATAAPEAAVYETLRLAFASDPMARWTWPDAHQGKGLGSALLEHALATCDRHGVVAYLESSNPRNIPLYERHGFAQWGRIPVGSSPTLVPMLRKPKWR